jgi:hypothetical protein
MYTLTDTTHKCTQSHTNHIKCCPDKACIYLLSQYRDTRFIPTLSQEHSYLEKDRTKKKGHSEQNKGKTG